MIHVQCPGCGSRLQAQARLAGKRAKCPKCGASVATPADAAPTAPSADSAEKLPSGTPGQHVVGAAGQDLSSPVLPERLDRHSCYLICDRTKLVATWEHDGQGWQINLGGGFASAARNTDHLPSQGNFKLVELQLETSGPGRRLVGLRCYGLASHWALPALARGDDAILGKLTGPAGLAREQKDLVRQVLRERFMPDVWREAQKVLEFLGNTDYHSPGTQ